MKNFSLLLLSIFIFESNAQISKDFTYTPLSEDAESEIFIVSETLATDSKVQKYATIDVEKYDNEGNINRENDALVTLYNLDHSLYKEVLVSPPSSYLEGESLMYQETDYNTEKPSEYDSIWVSWITDNDTTWGYTKSKEGKISAYTRMGFAYSTHLFNNDDKVEFMISWTIQTPYIDSDKNFYWRKIDTLLLYNEDGDILYNFGRPYSSIRYIPYYYENIEYQFKSTENGYVFIMPTYYEEGGKSYVFYSLGGGSSNDNTMNSETKSQSIRKLPAYPNPTDKSITIPYELDNGEKSELKVYNTNGVIITSKIIDNTFNSLKIDVSHFPKGIYIYKYNDVSESFIVK